MPMLRGLHARCRTGKTALVHKTSPLLLRLVVAMTLGCHVADGSPLLASQHSLCSDGSPLLASQHSLCSVPISPISRLTCEWRGAGAPWAKSVFEAGQDVLVVPQYSLYGVIDDRHGELTYERVMRPSAEGQQFWRMFARSLREAYVGRVSFSYYNSEGRSTIAITEDGPVRQGRALEQPCDEKPKARELTICAEPALFRFCADDSAARLAEAADGLHAARRCDAIAHRACLGALPSIIGPFT